MSPEISWNCRYGDCLLPWQTRNAWPAPILPPHALLPVSFRRSCGASMATLIRRRLIVNDSTHMQSPQAPTADNAKSERLPAIEPGQVGAAAAAAIAGVSE